MDAQTICINCKFHFTDLMLNMPDRCENMHIRHNNCSQVTGIPGSESCENLRLKRMHCKYFEEKITKPKKETSFAIPIVLAIMVGSLGLILSAHLFLSNLK